jgi:uncharacterized protein YuzB (UPF0349 family)
VNTIKICRTNEIATSSEIKKLSSQMNDMNFIEEHCLGNCGQCYLDNFVLLNDKIISFREDEDIINKLKREIEAL